MIVYEVICDEAQWEGEQWSEGLFERKSDAERVAKQCEHPYAKPAVFCDVVEREVHMTTADWKHEQFREQKVVPKQMALNPTGSTQ